MNKIFLFLLCSISLFSQSLWKDKNYIINGVRPGQLVEVDINESFLVEINSQSESSQKASLSLVPDTKNLPFLTPSEQNKNYSANSKTKYKIRDKYHFYIQAQIGEPENSSLMLYPIRARKVVLIDLKPTQIILAGVIDPKNIKNGKIESRYIADLQLNILTETPIPKDETIALKAPSPIVIKTDKLLLKKPN